MSSDIVAMRPPAGGARRCRRAAAAAVVVCLWTGLVPGARAQLQNDQAAGAAGDDQGFGIRFGGGYSDNIFRLAQMPLDSSYSVVGIDAVHSRESQRLVTNVVADIEYRSYSESTVDDEPYGSVDASIELQALPDRIAWLIADNYGQGTIDAFAVDSPLNRESINVFSTGPRFTLPLGARTQLAVNGTYSDRSFGDTEALDSESVTAELGLTRALSSTSQLGLVVSNQDVDYDIPAFNNEISTAYLRYTRELATGAARISAGTNEVSYANAGDNSSPFVDIAWDREVGARSRLTISVGNRLVDAAGDFRRVGIDDPGAPRADDVFVNPDVYELQNAGVVLTTTWSRSELSLSASTEESDYGNATNLSNDRDRFGIDYQRSLAMPWTLSLGVFLSDRTFDEGGQVDEDRGVEVRLARTFGRALSFEISHGYTTREGDGTLGNRFDENVSRIMFRYSPNRAGGG